MRGKKINPVNLVNPVYFLRFMASLIANERFPDDFWFQDGRNGTLLRGGESRCEQGNFSRRNGGGW
jgi:hypothetical protein